MTKAEFLHLNAGNQRWVLLRTIKMVFWLLMPGPLADPDSRRQAFTILGIEADLAAQEEATLED